jgi:hypothetical protein
MYSSLFGWSFISVTDILNVSIHYVCNKYLWNLCLLYDEYCVCFLVNGLYWWLGKEAILSWVKVLQCVGSYTQLLPPSYAFWNLSWFLCLFVWSAYKWTHNPADPSAMLHVLFPKVLDRTGGLVREVDRKFGCNLLLEVYTESCKEHLNLISVGLICFLLYMALKLKFIV